MGYVASAYDISGLVALFPISFLFGKASKPVMVGLTYIQGVGVFFEVLFSIKIIIKNYIIKNFFEVSKLRQSPDK